MKKPTKTDNELKNTPGIDYAHEYYSKWKTKSICRGLLWESCDLYAELPMFEATYRHYHTLREHKTFKDEDFRKHAISVIQEFYNFFAPHVDIWPMFGTLLGIVRDNDLIPHDDDVDFGVFQKDEVKIIELLDQIHGHNGFKLIRNQFQTLFSVYKDQVLIDLYVYEEIKDGDYHMLHQGSRNAYNLSAKETFPLKEIDFIGTKMKCINDPISFLERFYGKDWQTPK